MTVASSSSSSSSSSGSEKTKGQLKRTFDNFDSDDDSGSSDAGRAKQKVQKREQQSEVAKEEDETKEDVAELLSHKERRRLKKKQKLENADDTGEGAPKKSTKSKFKDANKGKVDGRGAFLKRQNSVWVGNLSFRTTPDSLRAFFEGVGEITRVHMPTKNVTGAGARAGVGGKSAKGENRGFAYVDFAMPDGKAVAISMSEKNLDGRRLLIKDGGDFTGRPVLVVSTVAASEGSGIVTGTNAGLSKTAQKILSAQKQPAGPCLFLGNLGFEATEQSIRGMIDGHAKAWAQMRSAKGKGKKGKDDDLLDLKQEERDEEQAEEGVAETVKVDVGIRKVRMGTFEDSGLCKGFAFVDFTSSTHATAALTNPRNHFLDGRKLVVEYASPDAARRGGHREKGAGGCGKINGKGTGGKSAEGRRPPRKEGQGAYADGVEHAIEGGKDDAAPPRTQGKRPRQDDKSAKPHKRPKPGAALALAQRENYAIVPSEGTRLTFT